MTSFQMFSRYVIFQSLS